MIRTNIESIIVQIEQEGFDLYNDTQMIKEKLPLEDDMSVKKSKALSI